MKEQKSHPNFQIRIGDYILKIHFQIHRYSIVLEKTIKETRVTLEELQSENRQLRARIDALESKMTSQTQYLQALHNTVTARSRG